MRRSPRLQARFEPLEGRQLLSADLNGDGRVNLADERVFVAAYGSTPGEARYNPAADFLGTGRIGPADASYLLAHLSSPPRERGPVPLGLRLAPGEQVGLHRSANSGGMTRDPVVTIIGHTVPNALVFTDTSAANYKFHGPAFVADDTGEFRQTVHLKDALTNFEFLVVTPGGGRTIRSYPIVDKSLVTRRGR